MVWRVLGTLLSLALIVYLLRGQGWDAFLDVLRMLPVWYFLAALGLVLLSRICVTLRWFILLRSAGLRIGFWQCLRLVFMGLFASNFLPSTIGGDLVRLAGALYLKLDAAISAASLIVDRLIGMAGMALFLPVGLTAVARLGGTASIMITIPAARDLWNRAAGFGRKLLQNTVYWVRNPVGLGLAFLCTLGHMLFTFLTVWLLLDGMRQPVSFWLIGGLWSLSYFVSLAPFSINGLGLQEVSIAYLYSHFGGVSMQAGLALAVLMRMAFLIASLPGVLFLPDILRRPPAPDAL